MKFLPEQNRILLFHCHEGLALDSLAVCLQEVLSREQVPATGWQRWTLWSRCRMTTSWKSGTFSVPSGLTQTPPSAVPLNLSTSSRKRPWQGMAPPLSTMSMYLLVKFQVHTVSCYIAPAAEREGILETCPLSGRFCVISNLYLAGCCGPVCILTCGTLQGFRF